MKKELDKRPDAGLAEATPHRELGAFDVLDTYAGGVAPEEPRVEALATISAGYKNDKGLPVISRNGKMHLHDPEERAPGLKAALEATGYRSLLITFPFDDPREFIQQRFVSYSKTRLLAYGDQHAVTVIDEKGNRTEYDAQTEPDAYRKAIANCSTSFSVYFTLVEWQNGTPVIVMPDGMGFYRIRFTGRNSARAFMGQMKLLTKFTSGRLAGIPFELRIVNRDVADPTGARRTIPVFVPTMKAHGMRLDSTNFRNVLQESIGQADAMQLTPPDPETIDDAMTEQPVDLDAPALEVETGDVETIEIRNERGDVETIEISPSDRDLARMASELDYDTERARFFAIVGDQPEEEREDMLWRHFGPDDDGNPRFEWATGDIDPSSLSDVVANVSADDWDAFLHDVEREQKREATIAEMREQHSDPDRYGNGVEQGHVDWLETQLARLEPMGFDYTDRALMLGWLLGEDREIDDASLTPEAFEMFKDRLGSVTNAGKWRPLAKGDAQELVALFLEWRVGDDAAQEALGL